MYEDLREHFETIGFTTAVPFTDDARSITTRWTRTSPRWRRRGRPVRPLRHTGEYYSLTDAERKPVVEIHVEATADDATVVAGAAGNVPEIRDLAEAYEVVVADALRAMRPDHTYIHEQDLADYYHRICDDIDLLIVIYKRGLTVPRSVLVDLSEREEVVAVKFAIEGATGYTTSIGNFLPEATLPLFDVLDAGDWDQAREFQRALRPLEDLREEPGAGSTMSAGNNAPVINRGLKLAKLNGGPSREPLVGLSAEDEARLKEIYAHLGVTSFDA
ncbi:dihydrodipicolinate synthase family protein (plasmid) [Natrinema zhouii]|uniref:dihydrodipicolinate synthase family protein n=1 Tax=Natrinema zhouii TaxID=1710539 RepID=UPI001CFFBA20|nr:dihydrodipicolinate synthase family protein [Natrinema zhouii]UHQ98093.1 dihydrodipicolinate synthase family protein [Natrinema zhouii]